MRCSPRLSALTAGSRNEGSNGEPADLSSCFATLPKIAPFVLLALFVAAYPVIEKIWLGPLLGRETVGEHERIESAE